MKKFICIFLLIPFTLSAQRYVSGQIFDADTNEPVVGASVFISNTTIGGFTDGKGHYKLKISEQGTSQLTVSYMGYQSIFKDIEPGKTSLEFNFDLHININELQEFTVTAKSRHRQSDVSLFWKTILGCNPSKRTIFVKNPETVYFHYNPDTRILKVTCREPLDLVNYETGYQIHYVLNYFTHDYNRNFSDWSNQFVFTELEPDNSKQKNNWDKKRRAVYNSSLVKFLKSLYSNSLRKDGFVLANLSQNPGPNRQYQISLLNPETILSPIPDGSGKIFNLSNQDIILFCYGRPVTNYDLNLIQQTQTKEFFNRSSFFMNLMLGDNIRIFPDGTYANKLQMSPVNSSNTLIGLNMKLPFEYLPEEYNSKSKEIESEIDFDFIAQQLDKQMYVYPQEKIHLHTDRDYYVPGERIWFKAYLADAVTFHSTAQSRYVYAELINSKDSIVDRVMIQSENDKFHGHIFLSENFSEGNYTLRAYTQYMESLGDDFFFKKNIRIGSLPSDNNKSSSQIEQKTVKKQPLVEDFEVSVFPEGGNLVEGAVNRVAFKALNKAGYPEVISVEITDETGLVITSAETFHAGMGVFSFMPFPGKKYFLKYRNGNGSKRQLELPKANNRAHSLTASLQNEMLTIEVIKSPSGPNIPLYLLAHCRGQLFYFSATKGVENQVSNIIKFPEEDLPAGVLQFILFDEQMNPLSERLVFNKNYETAKIEFHTNNETYKTREQIITSLSIVDSDGNLLDGNLSVAITDDKDIAVDSMTTILSTLLLSSELKGYIENPAYYLQDNPESVVALDYLMLTHGWRRYDIPDVIKGSYESSHFPFQTSMEISGFVKDNRSKPVADSEVLFMAKGGYFESTATDKSGIFKFKDFEYPDGTSYFIQALGNKGSNRVDLVLAGDSFPKPVYAPQSPISKMKITDLKTIDEVGNNAFIAKAEKRSMYDDDMRMIQLSEVVITGRSVNRKAEPRLKYYANTSSDKTIRREDINKMKPRTVSDILRGVGGVQVMPNGAIYIRGGIVSIEKSKALPLVLIDGVPVAWGDLPFGSPLEQVSVYDVESIDVFKGASAAIFGARGDAGAISITTRGGMDIVREVERMRGKSEAFNYTVQTPLGYQKPVEFYSPKYETLESKQFTVPDYRTTIFWNPDIVVTDAGEASFDFYTSDFPTTYSVVFEGLTDDGRIIRQVEKIRVE